MDPTTDIDSQVPSFWSKFSGRGGGGGGGGGGGAMEPPFHFIWWTIHLCAVKEGIQVINHIWVNNHTCSLPQNILVVIHIFVASDNLLELFTIFLGGAGRSYTYAFSPCTIQLCFMLTLSLIQREWILSWGGDWVKNVLHPFWNKVYSKSNEFSPIILLTCLCYFC